MTVTSLPVRDEYTATASQTVFNYTFKIFADGQLNVYVTPSGQDPDDSTDIITTYTIDPGTIGNSLGGFITLDSGVSAGDLVTIVSDIPEQRTTDYQNSGDFLPDVVDDDFDTVVSLVKQQEDRTSRTLSFPESLQNATALTLPLPVAVNYLRWKSDLSGLENVDLTTFGTPTDSSVITYTPPYAGSTSTTVETKLSEVVSFLDFGAIGDGVTDDQAAIQVAIDSGAPVIDGLGLTYNITTATELAVRANLKIEDATFDASGIASPNNFALFSGGGSLGSDVALTSNIVINDDAFDVASVTGLVPDDYIVIKSDEFWGADHANEVSSIHKIKGISGLTITTMDSIPYSYTTANNAVIAKITTVDNITFDRVRIIGNPAIENSGIRLDYCQNVNILNCTSSKIGRAWGSDGCINFNVINCKAVGTGVGVSGINYGVALTRGTTNADVSGCTFEDHRHGVTIGGSSIINRHITIRGNKITGSTDAGIDSHVTADEITISDNIVTVGGDVTGTRDGIISQGANVSVVNNQIYGDHGTRHGVFIQNLVEYAGFEASVDVSGNKIRGKGSRGVFVNNTGGMPIKGLTISHNEITPKQSIFTVAIDVDATGADITELTIDHNTIDNADTAGISVSNATGFIVERGSIDHNPISMQSGSTGSAIILNADAATDIQDFTISGNTARRGTFGVRGIDTDFILTDGNILVSQGTPISVAGAGSVTGTNITH